MGGGVGGFPTRSRRIKKDQDRSGWIKGDHSFYQQQRVVSRASMQIKQGVQISKGQIIQAIVYRSKLTDNIQVLLVIMLNRKNDYLLYLLLFFFMACSPSKNNIYIHTMFCFDTFGSVIEIQMTDQDGSKRIKTAQIKVDQRGSKWIKGDQDRSKGIKADHSKLP